MKNLLMILFLTFSFQVFATENGDSSSDERSPDSVVGQNDESMIDCTDQVDSNRGSDADVSGGSEADQSSGGDSEDRG